MKNLKKVLALVLAVVMIMGVVTVASAKTYKDADKEAYKTYADAIDALSSLKILDGFEDGEFKADRTFNRAQAAKIVAIVHNAATIGKIKDQTAISALYSNAQNPFVDCNTSWALPYINYCRITGLADGMTATTYAPKRELTGVQWLKLMLTTLNFDTAKEGYTGTGWDVNVLNRANEVGLTAGLADDWKAIAPIKRGEAAQILYNALTKYLVEYGQLVKNNYDTTGKYYKTAFISNEQVAKSGYTLGDKMGITIERATDDFRRPGYAWSYGSWAAFYMDKPVNTYTTAVTMCDILKNDIGVAETKKTPVALNGHVGGDTDKGTTATELKVNGKAVANTALNYYAVDGYKYTDVVLAHDAAKTCQRGTDSLKDSWKKPTFGGQGDLTQVFETEDGYVITTIHTFLAVVKDVNKNGKYSHATPESATVTVYLQLANANTDVPPYVADAQGNAQVKAVTSVAYAKGTKVLVDLTLKKSETENYGYYYSWDDQTSNTAKATVLGAAEAKVGKLTGASDAAKAESVSIDGTRYSTNCRFVLGKENAMQYANRYTQYTFYFDTYGNVIGCDKDTTAASYVVMTKIRGTHEDGDFVIKANLRDLEGKEIKDASVAVKGAFAGALDGYNADSYTGNNQNWYFDSNDKHIYMVAAHNDGNLINALYTYTVDDKGVYTLNYVGDATSAAGSTNVPKYGRLEAADGFVHNAKLAYISGTAFNAGAVKIGLTESTKFVGKSVGDAWTAYTGYTALPALAAKYLDYTDTDGDGFADIVYLGNATFAGDNITGWVSEWRPYDWANEYELITVYVDGEATVVNVKYAPNGFDATGAALTAGMYTFTMGTDADGVAYATAYKKEAKYSGNVATTNISTDTTAIKLTDGQFIGLTGVTIYEVKLDGSVVKADVTAIETGDYVAYYEFASEPYTVLYVVDTAHA